MGTMNPRRYTCPECRQPLFDGVPPAALVVPMAPADFNDPVAREPSTAAPCYQALQHSQAASNGRFGCLVGRLPIIRMSPISAETVGLAIPWSVMALVIFIVAFMFISTPVVLFVQWIDPKLLPESVKEIFGFWWLFVFAGISSTVRPQSDQVVVIWQPLPFNP
jgi:hypothetical protein